jgi:hypothetical protein
MFEYAIYRWKLRTLQEARRKVIERAPKPVEGLEFEADYSNEMQRLGADHRIYRLMSDYYYELAFRYGVPTPSDQDCWEESEIFPGTQHLNRAGLSRLRAVLRRAEN